MVDSDVSSANGKLGRCEVGVPECVTGLVLDVEGPEKWLLGDVMMSFSLDDG